jgi:ABC-type antimicrobial peptide transport system permease subunit
MRIPSWLRRGPAIELLGGRHPSCVQGHFTASMLFVFGVAGTALAAPGTYGLVSMGGVVVATLVPAWRAARTDPLRALRHQ